MQFETSIEQATGILNATFLTFKTPKVIYEMDPQTYFLECNLGMSSNTLQVTIFTREHYFTAKSFLGRFHLLPAEKLSDIKRQFQYRYYAEFFVEINFKGSRYF